MKELMIHVERIVRPVRAFAARKLRMRQELLAHLQASLAEERGADDDEAAALRRAVARLGDPAELTRGLQESVPWIDRMLLARLPLPQRLERVATYGDKWWKRDCPMTMLHAGLLGTAATAAPLLLLVALATMLPLDRHAVERLLLDHLQTWAAMNVAMTLLVIALVAICAKFIVAIAGLRQRLRSRASLGYGAAIVGFPLLAMTILLSCLNGRGATPRELLEGLGVGLALLASQIAIGRLVATLRRPYVEWLTLDVAG